MNFKVGDRVYLFNDNVFGTIIKINSYNGKPYYTVKLDDNRIYFVYGNGGIISSTDKYLYINDFLDKINDRLK
jgi:hypothetical protein